VEKLTKSANMSETRNDRGKVAVEGLQELTNALSNGTTPTPYGLLFPRLGFGTHPKLQSLLFQEWLKLRTMLSVWPIHSQGPSEQGPTEHKPTDCPINFWILPIISRMGKATNFRFCMQIQNINRNKSPLKISGKLAMGVVRVPENFLGVSRGHLCDSLAFLVQKSVKKHLYTW